MRISKTEPQVSAGFEDSGPACPNDGAPTTTALVTLESLSVIVPAKFFAPGGSDPVLESLEAHVRAQAAELDISTEAGRGAIASLAYKVARSKTALDDEGKRLVEDQKRALGEIDAERRRVRERLDLLKEEVRKPLTDWENAEKERVARHEDALKALESLPQFEVPPTIGDIEMALRAVELSDGRDWQEFAMRAAGVKAAAKQRLVGMLQAAEKTEAERAELARLRAEQIAREQREREERIAQEVRDAERKASEERERIARESAERERQRIENERIEAEARLKQAEAQRIEAEQKAARDLAEAEERRIREAEYAEQKRVAAEKESARLATLAAEKAERDRVAAIEAERARVAEEQRKEREAAEARERNKRHREKILGEVAGALLKHCESPTEARNIAEAIAKGQIPHCTVEF